MSEPVRLTASAVAMIETVVHDVGAGVLELRHEPGCSCDWPDRFTMACVRLTIAGAVPDKCAGPTGAGVEPNPCTEPGSLPRCAICPHSPTYWRAVTTTEETRV